MKYGYARVSTQDQDPASQIAALRAAGVRRIQYEHRGGAEDRPVLSELIRRLKPGDVLCVYKVDRLARSLRDLLGILASVSEAGATFRSVTEPIETATPAGRMLVQLLGAFAEFERAIIRERCTAGRVAAVARGVRFGRPRKWTQAQRVEWVRRIDAGESVAAVARAVGASRRTVEAARRMVR